MRYRARVEYDGTDYAGSQIQARERTVQGVLEATLDRLPGGSGVRIEVAGRTDAGVHALGQVVAFTYPGRLSRAELRRALNALLPADVAIGPLVEVDSAFRPRYAARYREYRYTIWNGPPSPLRERYALGVRERLDAAAMAEAAQALVGRHDFSAFAAAGGGRDIRPIRTLHEIRVRRRGRTVTIDVIGDAFLRQMVRSITAALLLVGRGAASAEDVAAALGRRERAWDGAVAPPQGLCLRRVVLGRPGETTE